ncbi:MAG: hypothetical protein Q7U51_07035, partial [Methanoregula sp.]|nr:hypothetical protein [Methanoregula sp.]
FEGIRKHTVLDCFYPHAPIVLYDREPGRDDDEYETEFQVAAVQPWAGEVAFGRIVEWASSGHALTGVFYESERYLYAPTIIFRRFSEPTPVATTFSCSRTPDRSGMGWTTGLIDSG